MSSMKVFLFAPFSIICLESVPKTWKIRNLTGSVHLVASFFARDSKLSPKVFRCSRNRTSTLQVLYTLWLVFRPRLKTITQGLSVLTKSHLNLTGSVHLVASFFARDSKLSTQGLSVLTKSHLNLTGSVHLVASFFARDSKLSPRSFGAHEIAPQPYRFCTPCG